MYTDIEKTGQAYRVLTGQDIDGNNIYDRLSFWTAASDVSFYGGGNLEEISGTFFYTEGILKAHESQVTISSSKIKKNGLLDIYVPDDRCHVTPKEIHRDIEGSVTLVFSPQEEDMPIRVVCKNYYDVRSLDNNSNNTGG